MDLKKLKEQIETLGFDEVEIEIVYKKEKVTLDSWGDYLTKNFVNCDEKEATHVWWRVSAFQYEFSISGTNTIDEGIDYVKILKYFKRYQSALEFYE